MIKLTDELKQRIDDYFESKTPDELYDLSIQYGLVEIEEDDSSETDKENK